MITASPSVQTILPAYEYVQYTGDPDIDAFFSTYNTLAQEYLTNVNDLNLPVFSGLGGALLDWVALGLYGYKRPILVLGGAVISEGTYDSNVYDSTLYNSAKSGTSTVAMPVSDDIFQRCLLWNLYTGDGRQFTMHWLKNRVTRFLTMPNGIPLEMDNTYIVSIPDTSGDNIVIKVSTAWVALSPSNLTAAEALFACVNAGVVNLPFQFQFSVTY